MFEEKPAFGWGPGTYQFQYAPFQFSREKTIISTNAGDLGNAHSEYLGALAETGLVGMLSFIAVLIFIFVTAVKKYTHIETLDCEVLRELVSKVLVYKVEKIDGKRQQRIDVIFNGLEGIKLDK